MVMNMVIRGDGHECWEMIVYFVKFFLQKYSKSIFIIFFGTIAHKRT